MFGAVMLDEENCRGLLEMVLGIAISRVEVSQEKSIVYHPEYKGIRLDVYARDEKIRVTILKCRWPERMILAVGHDITTVRLIWNFCCEAGTMQRFRILL